MTYNRAGGWSVRRQNQYNVKAATVTNYDPAVGEVVGFVVPKVITVPKCTEGTVGDQDLTSLVPRHFHFFIAKVNILSRGEIFPSASEGLCLW